MKNGSVAQRVRITFGVDGPMRYLSVLDLGLVWERLLRRARVPLAYTQGYNPHARLQFASALPVGYSSVCELLDVFLRQANPLDELVAAIRCELPQGLGLLDIRQVPIDATPLQATVHEAHYRARVWGQFVSEDLFKAVEILMHRDHIPRQRRRKEQMVDYDLRPLLRQVDVIAARQGFAEMGFVMLCGASGSGRPEEAIEELGIEFSYYDICRIALIWKDEKGL